MGNYGDNQYLFNRPEPSKIFLQARKIALIQLQNQFNVINVEKEIHSSNQGFKWVKTDLTYPSFDHLTFAFKNVVFAVVIELIDSVGSTFNKQQKENLLNACSKNNLIPCLFKINIQETKNILRNSIHEEFDLFPIEKGWNLYNVYTNEKITPTILSSDEPMPMSTWELSNFAIQVVILELTNTKNQILSFCDLLEINPQIWFKNKNGQVGWIIVKHIFTDFDYQFYDYIGLEKRTMSLLPFDGYYASVQFQSINTKSSKLLLRGDQFQVNYNGLQKIYSSMLS
jgi:hypothetical protein